MDGRVRLSTLGGKTIVDTDLDIIQPFLRELLIQFETVRFDWIGLKDTKPDVVNHFPFQGRKNLEIISKRETDIDGSFCFLVKVSYHTKFTTKEILITFEAYNSESFKLNLLSEIQKRVSLDEDHIQVYMSWITEILDELDIFTEVETNV